MGDEFGFDRYSALYLLAAFLCSSASPRATSSQWNGSVEFVLTEKVIVCMLALAFLVRWPPNLRPVDRGQHGPSLVIVNKMALDTDIPEGIGPRRHGGLHGVRAVNGFIVVKLKVNGFIATSGMSQVIAAVIRRIHDSGQITEAFSDPYVNFGKKNVFTFRGPDRRARSPSPFTSSTGSSSQSSSGTCSNTRRSDVTCSPPAATARQPACRA